jgi:hypothetical protein
MINYLIININQVNSDEVIYRLTKIFDIPISIASDAFTEFLTLIYGVPDQLTSEWISTFLKKMIGEFLLYKGFDSDIMDIKFSFNKGYISLFLIDKPLIIDNK